MHFATSAHSARREGPQNLIPTVTASIIMASCVLYLVFVKYELITGLFFRRPQNRSYAFSHRTVKAVKAVIPAGDRALIT